MEIITVGNIKLAIVLVVFVIGVYSIEKQLNEIIQILLRFNKLDNYLENIDSRLRTIEMNTSSLTRNYEVDDEL